MRSWSTFVLISIIAAPSACTPTPVNTVPEPMSPTAEVQRYDLDIPADLEIKAVDFTATSFTDVSGYQGTTSSSTSGRGFVKVYAVRRGTGEQYLLLYEDIARRKQPIQVIHFRPSPDVLLPGG
ncbi:MAG TPA: hypothetical protein VGO33_12735 [Gemmatimonadaceae bacterium]|nr:hypothetical protein [Gemmatimonadaceae bacterium]